MLLARVDLELELRVLQKVLHAVVGDVEENNVNDNDAHHFKRSISQVVANSNADDDDDNHNMDSQRKKSKVKKAKRR